MVGEIYWRVELVDIRSAVVFPWLMSMTLSEALGVWEKSASVGAAIDVLAAAELALAGPLEGRSAELHRFLDVTRLSTFLSVLPGRADRYRWADLCLGAIDASGYTLEVMLDQRVARHPDRVLFRDRDSSRAVWTFGQVRRRARQVAAGIFAREPQPRVAIFAENSVESACVDLACLAYGILDTPLNIHFDVPTLIQIFQALSINIVVTNRENLHARLMDVKERMDSDFQILRIDGPSCPDGNASFLWSGAEELAADEVERILRDRVRIGFTGAATVMFTSGSTGQAKGLVFSQRNLISKRFARAAALPLVGEQEVLLCYLPLFHTFGRYLEMLGMIFWGGTYCFAGNPSVATLLALMQQIRPTGLISIPLRWAQIHEYCIERQGFYPGDNVARSIFASETGGRLRWGLSAAGRLEPRVFRYFSRIGVEVCSGFGMTEATGGITMTPPGEYRDGSVGIPLPLVRTRLSELGELQISGPYVVRYLDEPISDEAEPWLRTGDLFVEHEDGHLEIVDRIKDIYKNSRGQTLAPGRVEQRFVDVPGIKRVFLVGDGKDDNALLIVPDRDDPVLRGFEASQLNDPDDPVRLYFQQIVAAANQDLAPYERVVNFALLDRDFSEDKGELTAKGTYKRKDVLEHFSATIHELYSRRFVELPVDHWIVRIPRWFFRDLTGLEPDIVSNKDGLIDKSRGCRLVIRQGSEPGYVQVGDLEYEFSTKLIDLGLLARQPLLWVSNPSLVAFAPCKDGWDVPLDNVSARVLLPWGQSRYKQNGISESEGLDRVPRSLQLLEVHRASVGALFERGTAAAGSLDTLVRMLDTNEPHVETLLRRRLECLARHPDLGMRCRAYRTLLLSRHVPDYDAMLRSFVVANLSFLDDSSIDAISRAGVERRRLGAFRQRLYSYRTQLPWPESDGDESVFLDIFHLLSGVARYQPEFYGAVREELVSWAMHDSAPKLAAAAERELHALAAIYERSIDDELSKAMGWRGRIVFQEGLDPDDIAKIQHAIVETNFLKQAIMLTHDGEICEIDRVLPDGIWVSSISSLHQRTSYRLSINMDTGKHYDLEIVIPYEGYEHEVVRTVFWHVCIRGYPFGRPVLPRFGCFRVELGIIVFAYVSDLNVWERIRAYASFRMPGLLAPLPDVWRKLFVRAMSAFFAGWQASGRRIVPGVVSPINVVVMDPDFRENTQILSIADYCTYEGPGSLVTPLVRNFYHQTTSHYPWCAKLLDPDWIFQACVEALGSNHGTCFLRELDKTMGTEKIPGTNTTWHDRITPFLNSLASKPYIPLAVEGAVERYDKWQRANEGATSAAREQCVLALQWLYDFERFPGWTRYYLYAQTYFETANEEIRNAFSRVVSEMANSDDRSVTSLVELSELQSLLETPEDREVFKHIVFPRMQPKQQIELLAVRHGDHQEVITRSTVMDASSVPYIVRDPLEPAEVGKLYRLYVTTGFYKNLTNQDRFLVLLDATEQLVGGLCYHFLEDDTVNLDGIVVSRYLRGRGLNTALLEDFCARMANRGVRVVKTQFFARHFYMQRGFSVDPRYGGLVRFLPDTSLAESACAPMIPELIDN